MLASSATLQSTPAHAFASNLRAIIAHVGAPRVVVLTPPPVHEPSRLGHQRRLHGERAFRQADRTLANTRLYARAAARVAREAGAELADIFGHARPLSLFSRTLQL